jgi:cyclin C
MPSTGEKFGGNPFPTETSKLAEMEFYLMDELECDLTIFHPYRTLMSLCRASSSKPWDGIDNEVGELGIFSDEKGVPLVRSQDERLVLEDAQLQRAWYEDSLG